MGFLESLYEIENFGIYLFVVIGVLVVLFLMVLFFGKRDQKQRKLAMLKQEETHSEDKVEQSNVTEVAPAENANFAFQEQSDVTKVEVPKDDVMESNVEPVVNSVAPTVNVVLNSELTEEEPVVTESADDSEKTFDFDALASAISKELESIENHSEEPVKSEEIEMPKEEKQEDEDLSFQIFEPVQMEEISDTVVHNEEPVKEVVEEKVEAIKPRPVMPTVFSSVYVNREKEEPKKEEISKEIKEEEVKPVKPVIDLPKMVDLPKRADEKSDDKKDDDGIIFPM